MATKVNPVALRLYVKSNRVNKARDARINLYGSKYNYADTYIQGLKQVEYIERGLDKLNIIHYVTVNPKPAAAVTTNTKLHIYTLPAIFDGNSSKGSTETITTNRKSNPKQSEQISTSTSIAALQASQANISPQTLVSDLPKAEEIKTVLNSSSQASQASQATSTVVSTKVTTVVPSKSKSSSVSSRLINWFKLIGVKNSKLNLNNINLQVGFKPLKPVLQVVNSDQTNLGLSQTMNTINAKLLHDYILHKLLERNFRLTAGSFKSTIQRLRNLITTQGAIRKRTKSARLFGYQSLQGLKVQSSGRFSGSAIAKTVSISFGRLPLQTYAANIDYYQSYFETKYGTQSLKVWVYRE